MLHDGQVDDMIETEMTEIAPQLAPGNQHQRAIEKAQGDRPENPLTVLALQIAIGDIQFVFAPDGVPDLAQVDCRQGSNGAGSRQ